MTSAWPIIAVWMLSASNVEGTAEASAPEPAARQPVVLPAPPLRTPFEVNPVFDGVLTAGLLSLVGVYRFGVEPSLPRGLACDGRSCPPTDVNPFDRLVIGKQSQEWAVFSDAMLAVVAVAPLGAIALDVLLTGGPDQWSNLGTELLLFAETMGFSLALYTVAAQLVDRPRPNHYEPGRGVDSAQSLLSFPSGHAVVAASAAMGYATMLAYRHPDAWWRWPVYATLALLVGLNSWGRLEDARHFPTDIIFGLAMGAAVGFVVPYLHLADESATGPVVSGGVRVSPWVYGEGGGLHLSGRF